MTWVGVTPRVAALHVLRAMFPEATAMDPDLTPAQHSAVEQARYALATRGLVLIADVVGSGKSYIALQLMREALAAGQRVLLTAPAALGPGWRRLLGRPSPVTWLSHTRLSLDDDHVHSAGRPECIVVDEAHAFRNPATRRYRTLARMAGSARLVLLTATPINNSLLDLYFVLRLGLGDGAFADLGVPHLGEAMRAAALRGGALSPTLRSALDSVVIRRSRVALRDAGLGELRFPTRAPPSAVRYSLDDAQDNVVANALDLITDLQFSAFEAERASGAGALLAMTLVKRLESSVAAFSASVTSLIRFHTLFLESLAAGRVLRPADAPGRSDQLLLAPLVGIPLGRSIDRDRLRSAVGADLHRLLSIREGMRSMSVRDRKLDALYELLRGPLADRRILLFTEFRETASALWMRLRDEGGVARIDGSSAWLGAGRASRLEVVRRFAPRSNGARPPPPREEVRLLIATDVLSEGLNLQDADTVISYDLPWNPVRLIQRVGRIDRLGSPHDLVWCYNFMPDRRLEDFIALVRRLCSKLEVIRGGLGEEEIVLASADATFLDRLVRGDPTVLDEPAPRADLWSDLRRELRDASVGPVEGIPVAELPGIADAVMLVIGPAPMRFVRVHRGRVEAISEVEAVQLVAAALKLTVGHMGHRCRMLNHALELVGRSFDRPAVLRASSTAGLAARRVLQLVRGSTDPEALSQRADTLLRRLARGLRAGEEVSTRTWVNRTRGGISGRAEIEHHLDELERCLDAEREPAGLQHSVVAAFVIRAAEQ